MLPNESVPVMIAWLSYRLGFPHNRLRKVQEGAGDAGMPLPASTQWRFVHAAARLLLPICHEILRVAALWPLLYNDDTHVSGARPQDVGARRSESEAGNPLVGDAPVETTSSIVAGLDPAHPEQRSGASETKGPAAGKGGRSERAVSE